MAQGNNGEIGDGRVKWGNVIGRERAAGNREWASQRENGKERGMTEGNNKEIGDGRVKGEMEKGRTRLREIMGDREWTSQRGHGKGGTWLREITGK